MKTFKKIIIGTLIAMLAVGFMGACSNMSGAPETTRQEEKIDEGDIVKVSDNGILFSFQSDGIIAAVSENGEPHILDYDCENYEYCVPLEMYVSDNRLTVINGNRNDFYTGDFSRFRSADYRSFTVTVYDISYLTEDVRLTGKMKEHIIYSFTSYSRLKESRLFGSDLFIACEYDDVYSPDIDENGRITTIPNWKRKRLTHNDTLPVSVENVHYNENRTCIVKSIDTALFIEPSDETYNSRTLTGLFRISDVLPNQSAPLSRPYVAEANAVYGCELNTVYMSENALYPIFSARSRSYGCGRLPSNLIITKFNKYLKLQAKRFMSNTHIPSRYAFKEIKGILFGTFETGSSVALHALSQNLQTISSVTLCYGEDLHAVTYSTDGNGTDYCLAVTFRNTDPLYRVDLSDPQNLTVQSELTITGYSVYLHKYPPRYTVGIGYETNSSGNIQGAKVTLFDTSNPETQTVNSIIIPDYGYAEVFDDPRAFTTETSHIVFGFALTRKIPIDNYYTYKQGFYLFGVKDGALIDIAYLTNFKNGIVGQERNFYDYTTYRKLIRRAIITEDYVYTVSDGMIVSYNFAKLTEGDKTPEFTLDTSMSALTGNPSITNPSEKQDGVFFED